jgi:hypothetical protein
MWGTMVVLLAVAHKMAQVERAHQIRAMMVVMDIMERNMVGAVEVVQVLLVKQDHPPKVVMVATDCPHPLQALLF